MVGHVGDGNFHALILFKNEEERKKDEKYGGGVELIIGEVMGVKVRSIGVEFDEDKDEKGSLFLISSYQRSTNIKKLRTTRTISWYLRKKMA